MVTMLLPSRLCGLRYVDVLFVQELVLVPVTSLRNVSAVLAQEHNNHQFRVASGSTDCGLPWTEHSGEPDRSRPKTPL